MRKLISDKFKEFLISIVIIIPVLFVAFLIIYLSYLSVSILNQKLECLNISYNYVLIINYILLLALMCIFVYLSEVIILLLSDAIENYAIWSLPGYYRAADLRPATFMFYNIFAFLSKKFKILIYILGFVFYFLSNMLKYRHAPLSDPIFIVMNDAILTFIVLDRAVNLIKAQWTNHSDNIFDFSLKSSFKDKNN